MEEGSNENDKKHPNIPSNYVTLLQLRERWIKEQQRKQKEKEEAAAKQNEESKQKIQEAHPIRRNLGWKHHSKNRNSKVTGAKKTNAVAASIIEENENETGIITNKEMKRKELTKKEKKQKEKEKVEEEEGKGRAQSPFVVKTTRNEKKSHTQMEYGPKINDAGELGVGTLVEDIDQKIGDLSIEKGKNRSSFQRQNRGYRGYNTVGNRDYWGHRGGNWRFSRGDGQRSWAYRQFNWSGHRKGRDDGMVWMRKELVADGGDIAASASSSKQL